uniref:Uncharacterized protein n=1 Tax=Anguilla anguilla TaxID=7936 RepID=A0A0E9V084_ANGAN
MASTEYVMPQKETVSK